MRRVWSVIEDFFLGCGGVAFVFAVGGFGVLLFVWRLGREAM